MVMGFLPASAPMRLDKDVTEIRLCRDIILRAMCRVWAIYLRQAQVSIAHR